MKSNEKSWSEEDGVITFEVTSDGTTGPERIRRFEKQGFKLSESTKEVLSSEDFSATSSITTTIKVIKGTLFIGNPLTQEIHDLAKTHGFTKPNAEVACLIRQMFSDEDLKDMGFWWIVVMHEPIEDFDGKLSLLGAGRSLFGFFLSIDSNRQDAPWDDSGGFAFAAV